MKYIYSIIIVFLITISTYSNIPIEIRLALKPHYDFLNSEIEMPDKGIILPISCIYMVNPFIGLGFSTSYNIYNESLYDKYNIRTKMYFKSYNYGPIIYLNKNFVPIELGFEIGLLMHTIYGQREWLHDAGPFWDGETVKKGDLEEISPFSNSFLSFSVSALYKTDHINFGAVIVHKRYTDYLTQATDIYNPAQIYSSLGIGIIIEKVFRFGN